MVSNDTNIPLYPTKVHFSALPSQMTSKSQVVLLDNLLLVWNTLRLYPAQKWVPVLLTLQSPPPPPLPLSIVTMGGPELFCFVVTSSSGGQKNRLATVFQRKELLAQGLGAVHFEISVLTSKDPWYAITSEDKAIPGPLEGLARKDPQCISNPHRNTKGARVIWHQLQADDISGMLSAYMNCPFFGIMREDEFAGEEMEDCPLVLQLYPKMNVHQSAPPVHVAYDAFFPFAAFA